MALSKISHRNPINTQFQLNCTILLLFTMAFNNVFLSFFVSDCCDMMYSYLPHAGKNKHASTISLQAGSGRQAVGQQAAGPRTGIHHFFFLFRKKSHWGFLVQGACGSFLLFFKRLLLLLVHECNEILQLFAEIT